MDPPTVPPLITIIIPMVVLVVLLRLAFHLHATTLPITPIMLIIT